jgi:hypothetical protein
MPIHNTGNNINFFASVFEITSKKTILQWKHLFEQQITASEKWPELFTSLKHRTKKYSYSQKFTAFGQNKVDFEPLRKRLNVEISM